MAINSKRIQTAPNAFEYSSGVLTIPFGGTAVITDPLLSLTSSSGLTFQCDILTQGATDDVKYKMQLTTGTVEEINSTFIEGSTTSLPWHDWTIPEVEGQVDAFISELQLDWWIPIPSAVRMVIKNDSVDTDATFYWSVRGQ